MSADTTFTFPPLATLLPETAPESPAASWADDPSCPRASEVGLLALVELVLKSPPRLHQLLRDTTGQLALLWRLLAISLLSFVLYGVAMSLVLSATGHWPTLAHVPTWLRGDGPALLVFNDLESPRGALAPWLSGAAFKLTAAYAFGLIAATGVCLPSLYFYCLLSGIPLTMVDVVLHAVKAKAVAAVALVGILPLYAAVAMGAAVFGAPRVTLDSALLLGLALPFLAGLWGTQSLYHGFAQVAARCHCQPESRQCFLRRLVLSWSACYAAVVPVMVFSLWEVLSRV
jgi:hypothetical protein